MSRANLNICQYCSVRSCDDYGINARFNLLFKEVCNLKSNPYILPIASYTILGGIRVGAGLTIDPSTGVLSTTGGGGGGTTLIPITSADFLGDPNIYLNSNLGNQLSIFWDDINRFIFEDEGEWQVIPGGIQILVPGFDATQNNYHLEIFIR